jgi:hypothetical protein
VISVAYVRAVRGFQTMLFQIVFSVLPTMLELALVSNVLYKRCGGVFAGVTLATFSIYLIFTVWITQWRINIRLGLFCVIIIYGRLFFIIIDIILYLCLSGWSKWKQMAHIFYHPRL